MPGIGQTMNIAKDALSAQSYGMNVTGHNIANVNNPDYSRQVIQQSAQRPVVYGGLLLGNGVDLEEVKRYSDQLLENRLMEQKASLAGYEETQSYMEVLESFFNENSDTSLATLTSEFWNAWHDLSNNPDGAAERVTLYEKGELISERFDTLDADLVRMDVELTREIESSVSEINRLTGEIAEINNEIVGLEANKTANDQRDIRNSLMTDLSKIINIQNFEQPDGSVVINVANGLSIVNGNASYQMSLDEGQVMWEGSYGANVDVTDRITGGKIGGWLEMRDEILPKFKNEVDTFAKEFAWAVNYQHSQGAGLDYFTLPLNGTYETGTSGLFSTLAYGNKIDYAQDFKMWLQDASTADPEFTPFEIDMGLSEAAVSDWDGREVTAADSKYVFTVVAGGTVEPDGDRTVTDGVGMGIIHAGADINTLLDNAIAAQTLTVFGGTTIQTLDIADGGTAERSAASIAAGLNNLEGVTAEAAETMITLDIANLFAGGNAVETNDRISFTLSSGGESDTVAFRAAALDYETRANFQQALNDSIAGLNDFGLDLEVTYNGDQAVITSRRGENIGIEDFNVEDLPVARLENFQNIDPVAATQVNIANFQNFDVGDTVTFAVMTDLGSVNVDVAITDNTNQTTLADDFETALIAAGGALAGIGVVAARVGDTFNITANGAAPQYLDLQAQTQGPGGNEVFDITPAGGTDAYPPGGNNRLVFDGSGDFEQYAGVNGISFRVNGTDTIDVDLRRRDPTDQAAVAEAVYNAMIGNLTNAYATLDGTAVTVTSTDESASDFVFDNGFENGAPGDATFDTTLNGVPDVLTLNGADSVTYVNVQQVDTIWVDTEQLTETGGGGNDSAVKTSTLTIMLDPGFSLQSDTAGNALTPDGGLFNLSANTPATTGGSILTLGGDGGYWGFSPGDAITFFLDGYGVTYPVAPGDDTDVEFATGLENAINLAGLDPANYTITRHGAYVSILRDDGQPIELTGFSDADAGGAAGPARLNVPANTVLNAATPGGGYARSREVSPDGAIQWERLDIDGKPTGANGYIEISDSGPFLVQDGRYGFTFDVAQGSLVAGNTMTVNTNSIGEMDPLELRADQLANSVLDTYTFTVVEDGGGTIGSDDVEIFWTNSVTEGSFTLEGQTPAYTPVTVDVDGMRLRFDGGSVFDGDVFTISTDEKGTPSVEHPGDWHWTIDSFADQFNRSMYGLKATVTDDYKLDITTETDGFRLDNFSFTGAQGFSEDNVNVSVTNYEIFDKAWNNLRIERDASLYSQTGDWSVYPVTNPGYDISLSAIDGFDLDNGFYVDIDGERAMTVTFKQPISDTGSMTFDITQADGDYAFAFSDDLGNDAGVAAALGFNTFFAGSDAMTIEVNPFLAQNKDAIAAAQIDSNTGELIQGNNENAIAVSELNHQSFDVVQWTFDRGGDTKSNRINTTIEDYYYVMMGSMGVKSQSISRSYSFNETMVEKLTEHREELSGVSLDEEMINMMKYQHAYTVASKLISVSDEMLNTLVSMR